MKISERFILFGLIVLAFQTAVYAQERCSFTRYQKLLDEKNTNREQPAAFEQWMTSRLRQGMPNHALSAITIPVVVHIIHNGESVGSLTNLSEAQILSQIDVLNKDFQRTNADAIQTPAEFSGVAGQLPVQFVLAKRNAIADLYRMGLLIQFAPA